MRQELPSGPAGDIDGEAALKRHLLVAARPAGGGRAGRLGNRLPCRLRS